MRMPTSSSTCGICGEFDSGIEDEGERAGQGALRSLNVGWGSGAVYWLIWLRSEQIIEKFASPGLRSRSRAIFSSLRRPESTGEGADRIGGDDQDAVAAKQLHGLRHFAQFGGLAGGCR